MDQISHSEALKILQEARDEIKKSNVIKEMCEEYGVGVDYIDDIPMAFADLDVSARTDKGIIYFNISLIKDGSMKENAHYMVHEIQHHFDQCFSEEGTVGSDPEEYLDNEFEQEGFKAQTEYLSETKGDKEAEKYINKVLDHHEIPKKEWEERKKDLLELAFNNGIEIQKKGGLPKAPPQMLAEITAWAKAAFANRVKMDVEKKLSEYAEDVKDEELSTYDPWANKSKPHPEYIVELYRLLQECKKYPEVDASKGMIFEYFQYKDYTNVGSYDESVKIEMIPVRVELYFDTELAVKTFGVLNFKGSWNDALQRIILIADTSFVSNTDFFNEKLTELSRTIRHELQHLDQSTVKENKGLEDLAGLPSKKIRDHKYDSRGFLMGDDLGDFGNRQSHVLQDAEFYTRLTDSVEEFNQTWKDTDPTAKHLAAMKWIDYSINNNLLKELPEFYQKEINNLRPNYTFRELKKKAPEKWRKAVKEFFKAINN